MMLSLSSHFRCFYCHDAKSTSWADGLLSLRRAQKNLNFLHHPAREHQPQLTEMGAEPPANFTVTLGNIQVHCLGVRGSVVVKALCYKPEGRGFETR
jgi:hypothetical protein